MPYCKKCGREFSSSASLGGHIRSCKGIPEAEAQKDDALQSNSRPVFDPWQRITTPAVPLAERIANAKWQITTLENLTNKEKNSAIIESRNRLLNHLRRYLRHLEELELEV